MEGVVRGRQVSKVVRAEMVACPVRMEEMVATAETAVRAEPAQPLAVMEEVVALVLTEVAMEGMARQVELQQE